MRGVKTIKMATNLATEPAALGEEPALHEEIVPAPEPWQACLRLAGQCQRLAFLESAQTDPLHGRYSYVAADPSHTLSARGDSVWLDGRPQAPRTDPLALLETLLAEQATPRDPELPPFQGGAIGYLGYDLCHRLERLPRPRWDEFAEPDLAIGIYDWVYAYDHLARRGWLIVRRGGRNRLRDLRRILESPAAPALPILANSAAPPRLAPQWPLPGWPGILSNFEPQAYRQAVARAIEYVHAGDCFQVNIAQRLACPFAGSPLDLYAQLRALNPAPFAAYLDAGELAVVSASPERFLRVVDGVVETWPIKGTRPRGDTPAIDRANRAALASSAKDRAENVMIVDLLRNDLGRVCKYGTISVPAVCELETFRHVHHLVSHVRGRLRPECTPVDLLRASFPGGSVTGAPKIRAMEIIAELEPTARGPYCGSIFALGYDGTLESNILIRTFTVSHGWARFPVGGGIVADSDPEREYQETLHKAGGLLQAFMPGPIAVAE